MNADLRIEKLTVNDLDAVKLLQPAEWGDIMPNIRFYLQSDFCYSVKAILNNELAGCGTAIVHENVTWLANIITHAKYRGNGIGTQVTQHLTEYALHKTPSVLLIATNLGFPIYTRLGFGKDQEYVVMKANPYTGAIDEEVIPYEARFEEDVLRIDREATGELRTALIRSKLDAAFIYVRQNEVLGFTIPTFGEGLTLATEPGAGIALMKKTLQLGKRVVIPQGNKAALDFLSQNGFVPDEWYAVKMHLGKALPWKPEHTFGRIGGNMG